MNKSVSTPKFEYRTYLPIMLAFFAMGFVDMIGTATNYFKDDFVLSDTIANILPSMVFFWFLIFSVPTGLLMNKIGRKKTVLLSLIITAVSLLLPLVDNSFAGMLISFSLLGIGNTLMQVSLNPLLSNVVSGERLASSMTFGQFVKAIASFSAPLIVFFRLAGCLFGSIVLARLSARKFFALSVATLLVGMVGCFFAHSAFVIYACLAFIGFGNSNVFPIIASQAMLRMPDRKNEVSALMIMGLIGGAFFPMLMGVSSDAVHTQLGAVAVMLVAVVYLSTFIPKVTK